MNVKIDIKLKPFQVPNFVIVDAAPGLKQEGMQELPKFHLRDLDQYTLEKLCEEFTNEVFNKAGKQRPPQAV